MDNRARKLSEKHAQNPWRAIEDEWEVSAVNSPSREIANWIDKRCEQKEFMPPLVAKEADGDIKQEILSFLEAQEIANLATSSPGGWPVVHPLHFVAIEGKEFTPVFYFITHLGTRKLQNIAVNPQVSLSVYNLPGYENRAQAKALQFLGIAKVVEDPAELENVLRAYRSKPGYEFTKHLPLEGLPCIRVDVLYGSWLSNARTPASVSIDYVQNNQVLSQ